MDYVEYFEVLMVIISPFMLSFITLNLYPLLDKTANWKSYFILDFITLILPIVFIETLFADYLLLFHIVAAILCYFLYKNNASAPESVKITRNGERENKVSKMKAENSEFDNGNSNLKRGILTDLRSTTYILTITAILAVDFNVFPKRFWKSEVYGFTLMDVGVGTFLTTTAMTAKEIQGKTTPFHKHATEVAILIILGLLRYIITTSLGLTPHVKEYGVHWNFFFTLAAVKIISRIILSTTKVHNGNTLTITGLIVLFAHQTALSLGLENYVFSDVARTNFFSANREGIVSTIGYVALYILQIATIVHKMKPIPKFAVAALSALILTLAFDSSRCVANSTYCLLMLVLVQVALGVSNCMLHFLSRINIDNAISRNTFIFEAINYNPLLFFLIGNVITGLVNLICNTREVGTFSSIIVLSFYLFANCLCVAFLYAKKIKIK